MSLAMSWYVIQTKPKKEEIVAKRLGQADFEVYFPQIRNLDSTKAIFPSYILIKANLESPQLHRLVLYTRGVRRILGDTEGPQPIAEVYVQTLRERLMNPAFNEQSLLFREGDEVRVKRGILKDLIGIIDKNIHAEGRVRVLFKWLHSSMRATLRFRDLEKAA